MDASVVIVAYRTESLDTDWIPDDRTVLIVHNDDTLDPATVSHPGAVHLDPGRNLGFGAAVNLALGRIDSKRVILANPDTTLDRAHWTALHGDADDVVTIPLVDDHGVETIVVADYPGLSALAAMVVGAGQLAPRGTGRRQLLQRLGLGLGSQPSGTTSWALDQRWVSGAVLSVDAGRLRAVGGFDEAYFLYYEDIDLCRRLAARFPAMRARLADVHPGHHAVGASATPGAAATIKAIRRQSGLRFAATGSGPRARAFQLAGRCLGTL